MFKRLIVASVVFCSVLFSCSKEEINPAQSSVFKINTFDVMTGEAVVCNAFKYYAPNGIGSINFDNPEEIHRGQFFEEVDEIKYGHFVNEDYFPMITHSFSENSTGFNTFRVPMKKITRIKMHLTHDRPIENLSIEIRSAFGVTEWVTDRKYSSENLFYETKMIAIDTINANETYVYLPSLPDETMTVSMIYSFAPGWGGGVICNEYTTDKSDEFEIDLHFD